MKKKILCIAVILVLMLVGCGEDRKSESKSSSEEAANIEIMDGMEHLVADNEYGYYFDIYSKSGEQKNNSSKIPINSSRDNLYFMIENAGEDRHIAVQIFIDYIQVPITIEGQTYETFFVETDKNFSKEFCFQIAEKLDESVDHKIMAAMTIYSDKYVKDSELEYTTNGYSIALDAVLDIAGNTDQLFVNKLYNYEKTREAYEDMWYGILINTELQDFKRRVPQKEVIVQKNEKKDFVYHVGGYDDCTEALVILCIGMKQVDVNQQKYMLFQMEKGKIQDGLVTITMPDEEGYYDLTGWIIKNPFSEEKTEIDLVSDTWRFTLNVQ